MIIFPLLCVMALIGRNDFTSIGEILDEQQDSEHLLSVKQHQTSSKSRLLYSDSDTLEETFVSMMSTVAGNGIVSSTGDRGAATSASINEPNDVAVDASGNIYLTEGCNVRKVIQSTGNITTTAGTGSCGYNGDNIQGTAAGLDSPYGIATDLSGNIYIADSGSNRIRLLNTSTGIITTVAGTGSSGSSGDGSAATSATLSYPAGIAVDTSGNIYIGFYSKVRKVISATGIITTLISVSGIESIAVHTSGNVFITAYNQNKVYKYTVSSDDLTVVAGTGSGSSTGDGGQATSATINGPTGVALDASGNIYIVEYSGYRVRKVTVSTGIIDHLAGDGVGQYSGDGGSPLLASIHNSRGIDIDASRNVYIADSSNERIRFFGQNFAPTVHPTGQPSTQPSSTPTNPSGQPSRQPLSQPSQQPTTQPTSMPSSQPSSHPSGQPSGQVSFNLGLNFIRLKNFHALFFIVMIRVL
jgi:sugar lactone lactonase YvrE